MCIPTKNSLIVTDIFLCSSAQENGRFCSGRKPPRATWLLVSTHAVIWQDGEISVGMYFCLCCTLPSSLRSVLAFPLVAGEEFSRIITSSKRHLSSWALGNGEVTSASVLYPSWLGQHSRRKHSLLPHLKII